MDQRKFCSQCSITGRHHGLTSVCLALFKYSSIFKLFLLLSDKRTIALCSGPGLLLQDSRVQTERVIWVPSVPILLRTERSALADHCSTAATEVLHFSVTPAADNPALRCHSLLDLQCTSIAVSF